MFPQNAQNIDKMHLHIQIDAFHNRKALFHNNTGQVFGFGFNFESKLTFFIYPILGFSVMQLSHELLVFWGK